jgi:hypothetical protein
MGLLRATKLLCALSALGAFGAFGCGGVTSRDPAASMPRFVVVGAKGTILSSRDAESWSAESSGVDADLRSVAAGGSAFVAVGINGTILSSRYAGEWEARRSDTSVELAHVIFTGEQFVAVGGAWASDAVALTSPDGANWSRVEAPPSYSFHAVALARGTMLAAGVKPSKTLPMGLDNVVLESVPPSTSNRGGWIERDLPRFSDTANLGDETLLVGSWANESTISRSSDGEHWVTQSLPAAGAHAIATSGADSVIVGGSNALTSSNGADWTLHELAPRLISVAHGAATFVAVGYSGAVLTSPDGVTWTAQGSGSSSDLADAAYGPGAN